MATTHIIAPCDITAPEFYQLECAAHGAPWSKGAFTGCTGKHYRTQALYVNGRAVGFTICRLVADEVTLMNIAVHPSHQGKGYGERLLTDILDYADNHHQQPTLTIFLEVRESNKSAIALYKKHGFRDIGRRPGYYPPIPPASKHETAIVMRR